MHAEAPINKKLPDGDVRKRKIKIRVSDCILEQIRNRIPEGISLSDFVRDVLGIQTSGWSPLNHEISLEEVEAVKQISGIRVELNRIESNLNQIARCLNDFAKSDLSFVRGQYLLHINAIYLQTRVIRQQTEKLSATADLSENSAEVEQEVDKTPHSSQWIEIRVSKNELTKIRTLIPKNTSISDFIRTRLLERPAIRWNPTVKRQIAPETIEAVKRISGIRMNLKQIGYSVNETARAFNELTKAGSKVPQGFNMSELNAIAAQLAELKGTL